MNIRGILIKVFIFLLPVAMGIFYFEYKLSNITNTFNLKKRLFTNQLDSIEVLAIGPSHTEVGVDPEYFSVPGFNLGLSGQSLFYSEQITNKYLSKLSKLKILILEVNYTSLYFYVSSRTESWRIFFYSQIWGINSPDLPVFDIRRYSKIAMYTTDISVKYAMKNFKVPYTHNVVNNGFEYSEEQFDSFEPCNLPQDRANAWNADIDKSKFNIIYNELENFVRELKKRNIDVAFINPPFLQDVKDDFDTSIINNNKFYIDKLCSKYDCKYFDYFRDTSFKRIEFKNCDHLNTLGAKHLSILIDSEIIRPIMEKRKTSKFSSK